MLASFWEVRSRMASNTALEALVLGLSSWRRESRNSGAKISIICEYKAGIQTMMSQS